LLLLDGLKYLFGFGPQSRRQFLLASIFGLLRLPHQGGQCFPQLLGVAIIRERPQGNARNYQTQSNQTGYDDTTHESSPGKVIREAVTFLV
jgi:hypothetical protein